MRARHLQHAEIGFYRVKYRKLRPGIINLYIVKRLKMALLRLSLVAVGLYYLYAHRTRTEVTSFLVQITLVQNV